MYVYLYVYRYVALFHYSISVQHFLILPVHTIAACQKKSFLQPIRIRLVAIRNIIRVDIYITQYHRNSIIGF
jgi:hypothetical protein